MIWASDPPPPFATISFLKLRLSFCMAPNTDVYPTLAITCVSRNTDPGAVLTFKILEIPMPEVGKYKGFWQKGANEGEDFHKIPPIRVVYPNIDLICIISSIFRTDIYRVNRYFRFDISSTIS